MKWTGLSILVALAIAGCGSQDSASPGGDAGKAAEKKSYKITLIAKSSTNPVFLSARAGAEAAAKELSASKGVDIQIDWQTPPQEDGQVQAQNIAQAVAGGSDAILIACSDAGKVTGAINDAVDKGVPVMTFDSDAAESKRFAFFGADDMAVGHEIAQELVAVAGDQAVVAILAGNQNAPNLQKRVEGVKMELANHPGVTVKGVFYHPETPQDAASEVKRAMTANPDVTAWAMVGGWPLFTPTLLTDLDPSKVKIVAVDCLPAQMPYVEAGIAPVLLAQPIFDWGKVSTEIIVKKIIDKQDVPVMNKMELIKVTKDSLKDWAKQLKEWGQLVDPKYLE